MPHARYAERLHIGGIESGIKPRHRAQELLANFVIAARPDRIVGSGVFRQIDQRVAGELNWIHQSGHFDYSGEGRWINDIGHVKTGQRFACQYRRANDAQVLDPVESLHFSGR